jgi:myb proto-oncogene protein
MKISTEEQQSTRNPRHFFTDSEDQILSEIMNNKPLMNWKEIAKRIPERSAKQCREGWFNYLAPGLKKGNWTIEEDNFLIFFVHQFGTRWSKLSKLMTGRTDNDIKNRWYAHLSKTIR